MIFRVFCRYRFRVGYACMEMPPPLKPGTLSDKEVGTDFLWRCAAVATRG
jgi:hypothetical protein